MIDREFLARLVSDPPAVLADFDLTPDERSAILQAASRREEETDQDRQRALQVVLMKRWAT